MTYGLALLEDTLSGFLRQRLSTRGRWRGLGEEGRPLASIHAASHGAVDGKLNLEGMGLVFAVLGSM